MSATDLTLMELHVEALYRHTPEGRLLETREEEPVWAPRFFLGRTQSGNLWRFRDDLPASLVRGLDALAAAEPDLPDLPREPASLSQFRALLQEHEEIRHAEAGPAYSFPEDLSSPLPVDRKGPSHRGGAEDAEGTQTDSELPFSGPLRPLRLRGETPFRIAAPPQVVRITDENSHLLGEEFAWLRTERAACEPALAVVVNDQVVSVCFSSRVTGRAAEAGVNTSEAFRGRGYAGRVVAAWAIAVREMGRVPLYSTSWDNLASQGVARRLGLRLFGVDLSLT